MTSLIANDHKGKWLTVLATSSSRSCFSHFIWSAVFIDHEFFRALATEGSNNVLKITPQLFVSQQSVKTKTNNPDGILVIVAKCSLLLPFCPYSRNAKSFKLEAVILVADRDSRNPILFCHRSCG